MNHNNLPRIPFPPLNPPGSHSMSMNMNLSMNMNMNMVNDMSALMMPPPRTTSNKPNMYLNSTPIIPSNSNNTNNINNMPVFQASKITCPKPQSSVQMGARWGHTSCLVDRRLFIIGGIGNNLVHDTCAFDFGTGMWQEVHTAGKSPGARYGHSAVHLSGPSLLGKEAILLFGGRNTAKKYFNDLYFLDTTSLTWTYMASDKSFPDPRAGHTSVLIRHPSIPYPRLVVFGGNYHNKYLNSVYVMDIVTSDNFQWYKPNVKGTPPCPRSGHTCTPIPNTSKILVFGGFDGKKCFNDVYIFCTVTFTWTQITPFGTPPRPRSGHTAALVADRFWVIFGGCSDAVFLNDFHILDLKVGGGNGDISLQWIPPPTLPLTIGPRFHHSCDTVDQSIVIFGGCASGTLFNDMVALDVSPLLDMPDHSPTSPSIISRPTLSSPAPSTASTTTTISTTTDQITSADNPPSVPTPLSPPQDVPLSPEAKPDESADSATSSSAVATSTSSTSSDTAVSSASLSSSSSSLPSSPVSSSSTSASSAASSASSPSPSQVHPPLTVLHSVASYNVPADIDILPPSKQSSKLSVLEGDSRPSSLELCLTSALASLTSEQQKVKELELTIAKERTTHASLRADYVSEQIKVKELEERLFKTEKLLRKSQKGASEGKNHSQVELQKAHTQIASLRSELSRMTEKFEVERKSHSTRQQIATNTLEVPTQQTCTHTHSQASMQQQLASLMELCIPEHLDLLEMPVLMQLQTASIRASENIAAAKDKKIEQLLSNLAALQIDLGATSRANQEKQDALNDISTRFSKLQDEHDKEKENLRHLVGEGLGNMDTAELEKLEEIHHTGLRNVGIAKTQALAQQVARLQREKDELVERAVCVVCADAQINTILSPCGHRCMCKHCADLLSNCPLCRKPISSKLQYFH